MKPFCSPSATVRRAAACLLAAIAIAGAPAKAQETQRIAAIVNDDVISMRDLTARVSLTLFASGLRDTPQIRARLAPQVMRRLIDERLQLQEAARLRVSVDDAAIAGALRDIERNNNMPPGEFGRILNRTGVGLNAMVDQLRAGLVWRRVVARTITPRIQVTEEDVEELLARIEANRGREEFLVSEIFLPVEGRGQRENVQALANNLMAELRRGAAFPALATMFSRGSSAEEGGSLGWVQQGQLPKELDTVLQTLEPGSVAPPINTPRGVHLVLLRGKRQLGSETANAKAVRQVFLPIENTSDVEQTKTQFERARRVTREARSCDDMDRMAQALESPRPSDLGEINAESLPQAARAALDGVSPGTPTNPVPVTGGAAVYMVCEGSGGLPGREQLRRQIRAERVAQQARRFLRDLRRQAYLDIRT